VSITERYLLLFSKLDFKGQLDAIKREDFRYNATVAVSDTSSIVVDEKTKKKTDNRLIQGWEWLYVILGTSIVIALILMYVKRIVVK